MSEAVARAIVKISPINLLMIVIVAPALALLREPLLRRIVNELRSQRHYYGPLLLGMANLINLIRRGGRNCRS